MTSTVPAELGQVAARFITTEYVTIDAAGQPIVWPVTPYEHPGGGDCIDLSTGLGYPKKARDAERNPHVALLFSDPTGSGIDDAPMVLVQGRARVDDEDLTANAERYARESAAKLPAATEQMPPKVFQRFLTWYVARVYVHVVPEVVWVWPGGDLAAGARRVEVVAPQEAARQVREPATATASASGTWDDRLDELGTLYPTAVVASVGDDGAPFAVRAGVRADRAAGVVRVLGVPAGLPLTAGRACVAAHDHDAEFTWQRNFQVRGELRRDGDDWVLVPRRVVGGFELPPGAVARVRANAAKVRRFRRIAKRELARRA